MWIRDAKYLPSFITLPSSPYGIPPLDILPGIGIFGQLQKRPIKSWICPTNTWLNMVHNRLWKSYLKEAVPASSIIGSIHILYQMVSLILLHSTVVCTFCQVNNELFPLDSLLQNNSKVVCIHLIMAVCKESNCCAGSNMPSTECTQAFKQCKCMLRELELSLC